MKKLIKQAYLLFFALSMTLIVADVNFIDYAIFHQYSEIQRECSDVSSHFVDHQSVCFGDDIFVNHSKDNSSIFLVAVEPLPGLITIIKNSHIASIWQPPKLS
jgi:hypothetical protein